MDNGGYYSDNVGSWASLGGPAVGIMSRSGSYPREMLDDKEPKLKGPMKEAYRQAMAALRHHHAMGFMLEGEQVGLDDFEAFMLWFFMAMGFIISFNQGFSKDWPLWVKEVHGFVRDQCRRILSSETGDYMFPEKVESLLWLRPLTQFGGRFRPTQFPTWNFFCLDMMKKGKFPYHPNLVPPLFKQYESFMPDGLVHHICLRRISDISLDAENSVFVEFLAHSAVTGDLVADMESFSEMMTLAVVDPEEHDLFANTLKEAEEKLDGAYGKRTDDFMFLYTQVEGSIFEAEDPICYLADCIDKKQPANYREVIKGPDDMAKFRALKRISNACDSYHGVVNSRVMWNKNRDPIMLPKKFLFFAIVIQLLFPTSMSAQGTTGDMSALFTIPNDYYCCYGECSGMLPQCNDQEIMGSRLGLCEYDGYYEWSTKLGYIDMHPGHNSTWQCYPEGCDELFTYHDDDRIFYNQSNTNCTCTKHSKETGWYDLDLVKQLCELVLVGHSYIINEKQTSFHSHHTSLARREEIEIEDTCNLYVSLIPSGNDVAYLALVNVDSVESADWVVAVRKGPWSQSFLCSGKSCSVPISYEASVNSGPIYFDVLTGSSVCGSTTQQLIGTKLCRSSDCVFCSNALKHMSCLASAEKFFLIGGIIAFILLVLVLFPALSFMFAFFVAVCLGCPGKLWSLIKGIANSKMSNDIKSKWSKAADYVVAKDEPVIKAQGSVPKTRLNVLQPQSASFYVVIILLALPLVLSQPTYDYPCSSTLVAIAEFEDCVTNGLNTTCTLTNSLSASIPSAGTSLCVEYVTEVADSDNVTVVSMEVTYLYAIDTITTSTAYFTAPWTISGCAISQNYLKGQSGCSRTDVCTRLNTNARPLSQDFGSHSCLFTTENEYGCTLCTQPGPVSFSCAEWAYGIVVPPNSAYEVRNYGTQLYNPYVRVKVTDALGDVIITTVKVTGTEVTHLGKFKVKVLGSLNRGSIPLFLAGTKVVKRVSDNLVWISPASGTNSPELNKVGDIQATAANMLRPRTVFGSAYPAIFIKAIGLVQVESNCPGAITFEQAIPGINNLESNNNDIHALPDIIYNDLWYWDTGSLQLKTNITLPPAIILSVSFADEMNVRVVSNLVCPVISLLNATGCFSCSQGVTITVLVRSSCASGLASVSISDDDVTVLTPAVNLRVMEREEIIHISTSKADNYFELTLSSGEQSAMIVVEFTASVKPPNITDPTVIVNCSTGAICPVGRSDDSFGDKIKVGSFGGFFDKSIPNWFKGVFGGSGGMLHEIIMSMVMIIAVVIVGTILFSVLAQVASKFPSSFSAKMYKMMSPSKSKTT